MATQAAQAIVEIPPIAFQDYPVHVQIRVYREGARYGADIFAVGQMRRVPIEMSSQDLVALNNQLQGEMQVIASASVEEDNLMSTELEASLQALAEVGHFAYKLVLSHRDARAAIQELLDLSQNASIQIVSEDFFLPWELIYPADLGQPLSYEHFWGMNYVISRVIVQQNRPGAFISPVIPVTHLPRLGLLTYSNLPAVEEKEMPFFQKLEEDGKVALLKLRPLDSSKKREGFKEFRDFLEQTLNLAHFACHAFYEDETPSLSRILLSDEFPITLMDMEVYGIAISGHPLIILNACETGNLNPLYTSYFAAAFLRYGARGVVATECAVPDAFAADFAQQLYTHLLAGEPLGESLLTTRRHFLEKHNNPSGLLYSMYAPPSIRLARVGG
jgi:hypothetical protein